MSEEQGITMHIRVPEGVSVHSIADQMNRSMSGNSFDFPESPQMHRILSRVEHLEGQVRRLYLVVAVNAVALASVSAALVI